MVVYSCMVLTPDQKKRIAALDAKAADTEEESKETGRTLSDRLKAMLLSVRVSALRAVAVKILIVFAVVSVAAYFVVSYQLHKIDFRAVFSSGRGSPIGRLSRAVKAQGEKSDLLERGRMELLVGKYKEAFTTAKAVAKIDPDDPRSEILVADIVDAVTQKATREFESGEIEAALADTRLALRYRSDHKDANELYMSIAARLLHEANVHHNKKEYSKLIAKAKEVLKIDRSNMAASNLLVQANEELLASADELFISQRHFDSLQMVRLSLQIDQNNPRALRLLNKISVYIETPKLKLRAIIKSGGVIYARIQIPESDKVVFVKEGDTVKNFKIIDIDAEEKKVRLMQIHTKHKFTIRQKSPQ